MLQLRVSLLRSKLILLSKCVTPIYSSKYLLQNFHLGWIYFRNSGDLPQEFRGFYLGIQGIIIRIQGLYLNRNSGDLPLKFRGFTLRIQGINLRNLGDIL